MTTRLAVLGAVLALAAGPNQAMAGYLTPAYEARLEGWLGEGNLTFTPIFEKVAGDGQDSSDFHAAVDGKGRTITLIKVAQIKDGNGNILEEEQFVGGYNPQSWSSNGSFNITNDDADRTAFIFNLTDTTILRQKLSSDPTQGYLGAYQTYNDPTLGPVFGAGNDLETYGSLEGGYSIQSSYGPGYLSSNVFGRSFVGFSIAGMEVYSLAPAGPVSAVPTPPGLVLIATGAVPLLGRRLRRRKSPATA